MARQICCVSSRPTPRLFDRSLLIASSPRRVAKCLGRIARRSLAAALIVGGLGTGAALDVATAHDHVPVVDEAEVTVTANSLPWRLANDAMLSQWLGSIDAANAVCGPAQETNVFDHVNPAGPQANESPNIVGGGGVPSVHPTTISQWREYCHLRNLMAWGDQARKWASPLLETAPVAQSADAGQAATASDGETDVSDRLASRELARGLADLSCEEPIDTAPPSLLAEATTGESDAPGALPFTPPSVAVSGDASEAPKFGAAALVGGGPIVATLEEAYQAYDLSPEDIIAMRMYPIDGPAISGAPLGYLAARRTAIYPPVPWHHQVEPSIVLATPAASSPETVAVVETAVADAAAPPALTDDQQRMVHDATSWIIAAIVPDSEFRQRTSAALLSHRLGESLGGGVQRVEVVVNQATTQLASLLPASPQPAVPPAIATGNWIAAAELGEPRPLVDDAAAPSERLLQIDLACQAALEVVRKQAEQGRVAMAQPAIERPPADELVRAQAVATAFDLAAESLEKLAMSLRRAGDSLIRQAKAGTQDNGSLLR